MENSNKYKLENEEEKMLTDLAAFFKNEREKPEIREFVGTKIKNTNFNFSNGSWFRSKAFNVSILFFALIVLAGAFAIMYNEDDELKPGESLNGVNDIPKIDLALSSGQSNEIEGTARQKNEIANANRSSTNSSESEMVKTDINRLNYTVSNISSDTVNKVLEKKGKLITSSVNLPVGIKLSNLNKELTIMLVDLGFKIPKNVSDDNTFEIMTNNIEGISRHGSRVEYKVGFYINDKNPGKLNLTLEYWITDKKDESMTYAQTMEDVFYKKMPAKIVEIFKNN